MKKWKNESCESRSVQSQSAWKKKKKDCDEMRSDERRNDERRFRVSVFSCRHRILVYTHQHRLSPSHRKGEGQSRDLRSFSEKGEMLIALGRNNGGERMREYIQ